MQYYQSKMQQGIKGWNSVQSKNTHEYTHLFYKHMANLAHKGFNFFKNNHIAHKTVEEKISTSKDLTGRFWNLSTWIYQTLCILSLIKNHTQKWKLEAICALRGQKYGFKTIFGVRRHIFDPWGHKWPKIFIFVCDFWSVITDWTFNISQDVFSVPIWKIEFFLPHFTVLPVFTKYRTVPKRAVGEKNDFVLGFRMKKYVCLKLVF